MNEATTARREWRARLALALGGVAFTWLSLEIPGQLELVRYYHLGGEASVFLAREPWRNPTITLDSERLFRRRGGTHLGGETKGDMAVWLDLPGEPRHYDVTYDEAGFRNLEPSQDAEIAVIGDSFVEVPLAPDAELLDAQLERVLDRRAANFGHLGYGPQQQLDVLRRDALAAPRKWIVWAFYEGNDLRDFAAYEKRRRHWLAERIVKRSLAYALATRLAPGADAASAREDALARLIRKRAPAREGGSEEILLAEEGGAWSDGRARLLDGAVDVLQLAREESAARGTQLLVAFVPTQWRVYRDIEEATPSADRDPLPERFLAACAERGITALDLTGALRARAREQLIYFSDDAHWNGAGMRVAADEIAAAIRSQEERNAP